jgi:exodeoxyribonuclease VII small subunit
MTKTSKFQFGKAFEELEKITEAFENDQLDLDEGLEKFERGLALANQLKAKLREVEQKVEVIKKKFSSDAQGVDLDEDHL